jgi:hypothetical protein
MSDRYILIEEESDPCSYDVKISGTKFTEKITLKRGKLGWNKSCQGEKLGSLENHGNGYYLKLGSIELDLDYAEVQNLVALLEMKPKIGDRSNFLVYKLEKEDE